MDYDKIKTEEIIFYRSQSGGGQIGGNNYTKIKFHCYVMLHADQHYSTEINNLITNYPGQINQFDLNKPRDKHITILDFEIELDDSAIAALVGRTGCQYKYNKVAHFVDQKNRKQNQIDVNMQTFGRFRKCLNDELAKRIERSIRSHFQGYPNDTTASMYPSKYSKKGPFLAVDFRTDLAFIDIIIPGVKKDVQGLFTGTRARITWSQYFANPQNIEFHASLGREKSPGTSVNTSRIGPGVAKNYAISPTILNRYSKIVMVEGTSSVTLS